MVTAASIWRWADNRLVQSICNLRNSLTEGLLVLCFREKRLMRVSSVKRNSRVKRLGADSFAAGIPMRLHRLGRSGGERDGLIIGERGLIAPAGSFDRRRTGSACLERPPLSIHRIGHERRFYNRRLDNEASRPGA